MSATIYTYAILRAVPHVHLAAFCNVGVIVHAPTLDFLSMRVISDAAALRARAPDIDVDLLLRYLEVCRTEAWLAVADENLAVDEVHFRRPKETGDEYIGRTIVDFQWSAYLLGLSALHDNDPVA